MVSISSLSCARNASPSSMVQVRSSFIFLITAGTRATAFTLSSQGCASSLARLFVSATKRAAWTDLQGIDRRRQDGCNQRVG